mmetsp:Transcript_53656/g.142691  ORF Transcript_53656/g.142691 Transcript_53656/m.142691 type:complete len:216 (-) Transcript_53656:1952-2599(-)
MLSISQVVRRSPEFGDDLGAADQRLVREHPHLVAGGEPLLRPQHLLLLLAVLHFPDHQESATHVLVCRAVPFVRDTMHNPRNLVHVHGQLLHQTLRHVAKVTNLDEAENSCDFVAWDHDLHPDGTGLCLHQIAGEDVSTGVAQADVQQGPNAHERGLQDPNLQFAVASAFAGGFFPAVGLILLLILHIVTLRLLALLLGLLRCTRLQVSAQRILR